MPLSDDEVSNVFDYMGRKQPVGRKTLELSSSSAGGGAAGAPITPSMGARADAITKTLRSAGPGGAGGAKVAGGSVDPLSLTRTGLSASKDLFDLAQRIFANDRIGGEAGQLGDLNAAAHDPVTLGNAQVDVGGQAVDAGTAFPGETLGELSAGEAAAGGGEAAAGAAGATVAGTVGTVLPLIGSALSLAQDITSNAPDRTKAINAGIDAVGAVAAPFTGGASVAATPFAKADVARSMNPNKSTAEKVIAYPSSAPALVSDLVSFLGGPDLVGEIFGSAGPTHFQAVRGRAGREAGIEGAGLSAAYTGAAQSGDLPTMQRALQQEEGQRVRSDLYLPPDLATQLGLPAGYNHWGGLTDEQFGKLLDAYAANPDAIELRGSGDVPYLPQGQAQQMANSATQATRNFLAYAAKIRQAQQEPAATTPKGVHTHDFAHGSMAVPGEVFAPAGPKGALGFAQDVLSSEGE